MRANDSIRRRWFRFSLRTLFVMVTVFGCWLGWQFHIIRERNRQIIWAGEHSGLVHFKQRGSPSAARVPFPREFFGDRAVDCIAFSAEQNDDADLTRVRRWFPEALVLVIEFTEGPPTGTFSGGALNQYPTPDDWPATQVDRPEAPRHPWAAAQADQPQ